MTGKVNCSGENFTATIGTVVSKMLAFDLSIGRISASTTCYTHVLSVLCIYNIMCSTPHQVLPKSIAPNVTDPKPVFEMNGMINLAYLISY